MHLAKLINLIESGALTGKLAKMMADEMLLHPEKDPHKILEDNPALRPISDTAELEKIIDQVLNENPQSVADFKQGTAKAFGFLMGRIMQLTKGQANPEKVSALLRQKLA